MNIIQRKQQLNEQVEHLSEFWRQEWFLQSLAWRLRPKVQTLTLLYTIFDRKGKPIIYLP